MRFSSTAAVVLVMSMSGSLQAAEDSRPYFSLKQDVPETGSNIKRSVMTGSVLPLDKRYDELTVEQQAFVRSQYEQMGPDDEPPFPVGGLGPIYKQVVAAQQRYLVSGSLSLEVEINGQGEAKSVSVLKSPSPEMTKFVASVLMLQKYKPALCSGTPCTMQFPFRIAFQKRL